MSTVSLILSSKSLKNLSISWLAKIPSLGKLIVDGALFPLPSTPAGPLQLERISVSGNVKDLKQTTDTYIILNCGSSTEVM